MLGSWTRKGGVYPLSLLLVACLAVLPSVWAQFHVGLLFPLTNHGSGGQRAAAAITAINHINSGSDPLGILTGVTLRAEAKISYDLEDTEGAQGKGMNAALSLVQNRGAKGLIGAASSAVSASISYLASALKIPQISYSSTSASLSNKNEFPYFLRTVPPDSLQAEGLIAFIKHMGWKKTSVLGENSIYGQGLVNEVMASAAARGIGIAYSGVFDANNIHAALEGCRTAGSRIIILAAQGANVQIAYTAIKTLHMKAPEFQWLGSDGVMQSVAGYSHDVRTAVPGTVGIVPDAGEDGSKYQKFLQLWQQLKADDFPMIQSKNVRRVADSDFASPPNAYSPFAYDAVYVYALAINKMLEDGKAVTDGAEILSYLKNIRFDGLTGPVSFNANGDRLANYRLVNFDKDAQVQRVATYSPTSGVTITAPIHWATLNNTVPEESQCPRGYYVVTGNCIACPAGSYSLTSNSANCTMCPPGTFADNPGTAECIRCPLGTFQDREGQSQCERCGLDQFGDQVGAPVCSSCPEGSQAFPGATNKTDCVCKFGYFALSSNFTKCETCPFGAKCPGGLELVTEPGYFQSAEKPEAFNDCEPPEACLGGTPQKCANGYLGANCGDCDIENFYYRLGPACEECGGPGAYGTLFAALCIIPIFFVFFLLWASAAGFNNSSLNVLLDFFQVLAVLGGFRLSWPNSIKTILVLSSVSNFNIDLFRIECNVVVMHHYTRWIIWMFLPFLLGIFMIAIYAAGKLIRSTPWFKQLYRPSSFWIIQFLSLDRHDLHKVWGGAIVRMMVIAYVMVLERVFSHFTCTQQNDKTWVMEGNRSLTCYDRQWKIMLVPGLLCILLYCAILPGYFFYKLKINRMHPSRDFSIVFRALYDDYHKRFWWWEIVIMVRIMLVLFTAGAFTSTSLQTSALLFIQFGFVMICVYTRPYVVRRVNTIQVTAECCLFATLMAGLMWTKGEHDGSTKVLIEVIMIIFICGVLLVTVPSVFKEMVAFHKSKQLDPIFEFDTATRKYHIHWNPESAAHQFARKTQRRRSQSQGDWDSDSDDEITGDHSGSPYTVHRRSSASTWAGGAKDVELDVGAVPSPGGSVEGRGGAGRRGRDPVHRLRTSSTATGSHSNEDDASSYWDEDRDRYFYYPRTSSYTDEDNGKSPVTRGVGGGDDDVSASSDTARGRRKSRRVSWHDGHDSSDLGAGPTAGRPGPGSGVTPVSAMSSSDVETPSRREGGSSTPLDTTSDTADAARTYSFKFGDSDHV
eukprot:TRINITY_DN2669_c0_g1_i1.p1 TRINITY_DN2669_c0_g1~~TRINITY_DN2669_c0_g1_i1.p1  ORF type:complete len:1253 (+),score=231.12 TRINITY_DN2669_c0_g1_i1:224-3982(+)